MIVQPSMELAKYSIGTMAAMNTLDKLIVSGEDMTGPMGTKRLPYSIDTIMINLETLVRNIISDRTIQISDYKNHLHNECLSILDDVRIAMESLEIPPTVPYLIFYYIDHRKTIPEEYLRPGTKIQNDTMFIASSILKTLPDKIQQNGSLSVRTYSSIYGKSAHGELVRLIQDANNSRRVIMLSHMPIDFHVASTCLTFRVVQSNTGTVLWPKEFSNKVFGDNVVPFLPETHGLLGDKVLLKPQLTMKEKKELRELATNESWNMRTGAFVVDSLKEHNIQVKFNPVV